MPCGEGLAERIREVLADVPEVAERKMFGGLCLLVSGNMCCGILEDVLMARVGPQRCEEYLKLPHAREMDFTGKPMKGMVYVDPQGISDDESLRAWIGRCLAFINTLPPK